MARQSRLFVPGCAHLIVLRALHGLDPCPTAEDRDFLWRLLCEQATAWRVRLHAAALLPSEVRLLAAPEDAPHLSRFVQAVGRHYVSAYNRAHKRSGTLWSGRFRAAAIAPGEWTLRALRFVDAASSEPDRTAAGQRCGGPRRWPLADPPEYWSLGNTPFERERVYLSLLNEPLPEGDAVRLSRSINGGWPCGNEEFLQGVESGHCRSARPRPRGRPPGKAAP